MTAYGRGESSKDDTLYIVEARALNHRYLDIILRVPKNFLAIEKDLKAMVSSRIKRGHIEVFCEIQNHGGDTTGSPYLNEAMAGAYLEAFNQMAKALGVEQKMDLNTLFQMKDVIIARPAQIDNDTVKACLEEALNKALDQIEAMRLREGDIIEADFQKRLSVLGQYLEEIKKRTPELVEEYRKRLKDNIARMLNDIELDEMRIAQEVALLAEKSDITEETLRIDSHLGQFRQYLSSGDPVGRRLDFLIQEINREVNTVGSKISDPLVSRLVVEMKAELEKLREQVQNVE